MGEAGKTYTTFNKIRLSLFVRSYGCCVLRRYVWNKYKIDSKLNAKDLRKRYFNKHAIPEISRLSRVLNLSYSFLWKTVLLNKRPPIPKGLHPKEKIQAYLAVENELSTLITSRWTRSKDFFDPDYEEESAMLSIAIERAVGNKLAHVDNDLMFQQRCEDLQKPYRHWYYHTAYKYKLPTTRIFPFVLRLIIPSSRF